MWSSEIGIIFWPVEADPVELTAAEAQALGHAAELDSGTLVERLTDLADLSVYGLVGPDDLRQLAAISLVLARRFDTGEG